MKYFNTLHLLTRNISIGYREIFWATYVLQFYVFLIWNSLCILSWIHFLALKVIATVPKPLVDYLMKLNWQIGILLVLSNIER